MNLKKTMRRYYQQELDVLPDTAFNGPLQKTAITIRTIRFALSWQDALGIVVMLLAVMHYLLKGGLFSFSGALPMVGLF
jgi:hypothetical protein